ncbi:hypothetical protein L7F22_039176 [Adiantum nelumboides]|nr:hypothetical protein [Adiantum nelumboides]
MSMLNGSFSDPAAQMATDANFDNFIESDLILDNENAISENIATPSKKKGAMGKSGKNKKVTPLSALPSKLSSANVERHTTPNTPGAAMNEFINFSQASDSTVTTPTTSNSSSLHNLSFDLYDGSDGAASVPGGNDVTSPEADMSNVATPSATSSTTQFFGVPHNTDRTMSEATSMNAPMSNPLYGMHHMSDGVTHFQSFMGGHPMPLLQQRSVDDMGHQFGHQNLVHHHGHHQRSMSLRDMASNMQGGIQAFTPQALASFGYPAVEVKMEHELPNGMPAYPMPTIPMADPANVQGQDGNEDKPRCEKKRRLTNGSSTDGKESGKGAKGGNAKKAGNNARKRSNTASSKNSTTKSKSEADQKLSQEENKQISANSLIESVPQMEMENDSLNAEDTSLANSISHEQSVEPEDEKPKKKTGTKRPPPSAFQITEAGMPFPVIDTSAKHSSLFIPPDTSGLTKREARLVKNRAAAFLSRQRKREQFEELEIKCRNLCRLVWLLYETGSGSFGTKNKNAFGSQDQFANFILQQEGEEVQEIFNTVLALKGGSIAPTEDGQLQGAVAAGIKSENGKLVGDASAVVHIPSSAAKAAEEASKELARLRCELDEHQKREASLHAELAHERGLRLKMEFDLRQREEEMKPFRGGGQQDLSLTQPATFDDEDDNEDEEGDVTLKNDAHESGRIGQNGKKKAGSSSMMRPSRTSRRIQGQAQNVLTVPSQNASSTAVGQRKAAGAALMMVLFSFALFGLPGGQTGHIGGISHAPGSSDLYPLGRVLGAPLSGSHLTTEEDEEGSDNDRNGHLPPSSHLSVDDLFPAMHDIISEAHQEKQQSDTKKPNFNFDYQAFAKDLESSLDWDMQRGFLVLGGDEEGSESKEPSRQAGSGSPKSHNSMDIDGHDSESEVKDAPTKLTLFVPAPDMSVNSEAGSVADASEDRFYDAPLADFDERSNGESFSDQQRELTQAEATRAALQVLRNHRVASEAAAFAASRRLGRQPSPSQRVRSPSLNHQSSASSSNKKVPKGANVQREKATRIHGQSEENEDDDEEDFSNEVLEASSSATDRIRGTDFYQLEFSLSGAKVRNVAELARLLGSMRGGKGDGCDHIKVA